MKKLLIVANVAKEHIRKFHIPFIINMKEKGWQVDVACRLDEPVPEADHAYDLPCDRNPFQGGLSKSIKALKTLIKENNYDVIHCNTVTGNMIARIAAQPFRKNGLKVFYTCHGLHFFKGAPLSRWLLGYPVEKILSHFTDLMITINTSDYEMAKQKLKSCKAIEKIHGIGVDFSKYQEKNQVFDPKAKRRELGIEESDLVLIYVAELNDNKNQSSLLNMFEIVKKSVPDAKLILAGPDHNDGKHKREAAEKHLSDSVLFLGWRSDIPELLKIADIYTASSKSEGLPLNLLEAMASELPVVAYKNRGHCEIIAHEKNGFLAEQNDAEQMAGYVLELYRSPELKKKITEVADENIKKYCIENVLEELGKIYEKYALNRFEEFSVK